MINPNRYHRVAAKVSKDGTSCVYEGNTYHIHYRFADKIKKEGSRYVYLNYSIMSDEYVCWAQHY